MNLNDIVETPLYQAYANCPPDYLVRLLKNLMIVATVPERIHVNWNTDHLRAAFYWDATPQGHGFWSQMGREGEPNK